MTIRVEHWWNDTTGGKPRYSKQNLSVCHSVHQKSHMDRPGIKPRVRGEKTWHVFRRRLT